MKSIVISGIGRCGKSFIACGLALNLKNCGYFKPLGERRLCGGKMIDEDISLMKKICYLSFEDEEICPGFLFPEKPVDIEKIKEAYNKVSQDKDCIVVEGDLIRGERKHLGAFHIAKALNTKILLVVEEKNGWEDEMAFLKEVGRDLILGVVLNKVRNLDEVKKEGFLGIIPYKEEFFALSVSQIKEVLNANILAGDDGISKMVEHILVGAMTPQYALGYFERTDKKAVITGGDRTDLILPALTEDTSCIITTGDIIPSPEVIRKAEVRKIPILSVSWDTLTTASKIEGIIPRISPDNKAKLSLIKELTKPIVDTIFNG
ncbi:MAG: DRTGG domain-containing protein [bacterium]